MYAVYAAMEPKRIKYHIESQASVETVDRLKLPGSPRMKLPAAKGIPAANICQPTFTLFEPLGDLYFEKIDPAVQQNEPNNINSIDPISPRLPLPEIKSIIFSQNNKMIPIKPMIRPAMVGLFLKLNFHIGLSMSTNQNGAAETRIATNALGNTCSTQMTTPVPPNNISIPLTAEDLILLSVNIFSPLSKHQPSINDPAIKNRNAPRSMGGNPFSASRIKKYVEPQTIYTVAKETITSKGDAILFVESVIYIFCQIKTASTPKVVAYASG